MFTNILCPVDFSKDSERALACALSLARATAGHLTLVTVVDPLLNAGAEAAGAADTLHQQTQQELRSLLERSAAAGPLPGVPAVAVRIGNAAHEILAQAEECNADVVVMGHRHRPSLTPVGSGLYVNLGDWITHFTYAVHDTDGMHLMTMKNGHPAPFQETA